MRQLKPKVNGFIYKIISPKGYVYIGQTFNIEERTKFYRLGLCKRQIKLYRSILKYGWSTHTFEVLEVIPYNKQELDILEKHYIKIHDSFNTPLGLNLTDGGTQARLSDATLKRMSASAKGRKVSDETKLKLRLANLGKKQDPAVSAKIWAKTKGKKRTPETCKRMSEAKMGKKCSPSHILAMKNRYYPPLSEATKLKKSIAMKGKGYFKTGHTYNNKKVIDKVTGQIFDSLTIACNYYGYNYGTIKCHVSGKVKKNKTNLIWLKETA